MMAITTTIRPKSNYFTYIYIIKQNELTCQEISDLLHLLLRMQKHLLSPFCHFLSFSSRHFSSNERAVCFITSDFGNHGVNLLKQIFILHVCAIITKNDNNNDNPS